jgi:uroporphyrinogen-III decarboxylase
MDFAAHNAEVAATWKAFNAGNPTRVPIVLGTNTRYFMFSPEANTTGLTFRPYFEDPDVMFDALLRYQRFTRFNLLQDAELGLPSAWYVAPDFQNVYEAAWFGCPIAYMDDQVPDTHPVFAEHPEGVMDRGIPDPFGGIMRRALDYADRFRERAASETYLDRPITAGTPWTGLGTDGPMTVACNLFSPTVVCTMMAEDPPRLARLFEFITEATIARVTAWRKRFGQAHPQPGYGIADDSIALISTNMYRQHVLPHHRRIMDTLGTDAPRNIHLCGDATRHFLTIRDELNVWSFDTGFPVDFARLRRTLGPKVRIQGGPHVELLRSDTPQQVYERTRQIHQSGVIEGGLFVLREGNNLAPLTPLENTEAMYRAGREFGRIG